MVATTFPVTVFSLALPQLEHEFRASLDAVTWVLTAPLLTYAMPFPYSAVPATFLGHRRVFLAGRLARAWPLS